MIAIDWNFYSSFSTDECELLSNHDAWNIFTIHSDGLVVVWATAVEKGKAENETDDIAVRTIKALPPPKHRTITAD